MFTVRVQSDAQVAVKKHAQVLAIVGGKTKPEGFDGLAARVHNGGAVLVVAAIPAPDGHTLAIDEFHLGPTIVWAVDGF